MCRTSTFAILVWATSFLGALAQTPAQQPPASMTCAGDKVVWVNTRSHVYHFQGDRYFGATKQGKFLCAHDADKEGDRPTRSGH